MKYGIFRKDEKVVAKAFIVNEDKLPTIEGAEFSFCTEEEYHNTEVYQEPVIVFDPNDFDEWLIATYIGTDLEQYFPVLSRATEKDNPRGYEQMLAFAQIKGVSQSVQDALISKLIELGANITQ